METRYLSVAEESHFTPHDAADGVAFSAAPVRAYLESAIGGAQAAAVYGDADLAEQACLLAVGISQNQPFLDGNKRTALYSLIMFLRVNDHTFTGDPVAVADQLIAVAERTGSLEEATAAFAAWLRERIAPTPDAG